MVKADDATESEVFMSTEDIKRASREAADRLTSVGVRLTGRESPDELTEMQDAVERFEEMVTSRGGDLMVDEGAPGREPEPDDPHFALPTRDEGETVTRYLEKLAAATDVVRRHRVI